MSNIQMVDLKTQYNRLKPDIDKAIFEVIESTDFIQGQPVRDFTKALSTYLNVKHVIPCANGTDALQIALMGLGLKAGDEIITPSFTYFATVEVLALLGLKPVFCEVNEDTFTIDPSQIESLITPKTKAIVPVHLYGQSAQMDEIMAIATKHQLYVIEDDAQAIGGKYTSKNGESKHNGTIGDIGCTSFFPSKNLGCYGDGGAIFTNQDDLAEKLRMIANHGQKKKYIHELVGCNSRLDTLQAAILNVKLPHLDDFCQRRRKVAEQYNAFFASNENIITPKEADYSYHVYHQYTMKLVGVDRDRVKEALANVGIPSMIYYPIPTHKQKVIQSLYDHQIEMPLTEALTKQVLSLPIHTEMQASDVEHIANTFLQIINSLK
ncbi:MAG: DegT/DnrJ/EryC1/StrS family aminotransferase [Chitinophagaceae bacterium]